MDTDIIVEFWETVKEYLPAKDKQTAADHVVTNLVEAGADDEILIALQTADQFMETAVKEHLEEDNDNHDEEWSEDY